MQNHVDAALDEVPSASAPAAKSGNSQCDTGDTVDGRNPAPVEVGSLSHYLQDFIHPRWCRISEPSTECTSESGDTQVRRNDMPVRQFLIYIRVICLCLMHIMYTYMIHKFVLFF